MDDNKIELIKHYLFFENMNINEGINLNKVVDLSSKYICLASNTIFLAVLFSLVARTLILNNWTLINGLNNNQQK